MPNEAMSSPTPHESIRVTSAPVTNRWIPVVGRELRALLSRRQLKDVDTAGVELETCRILSKCVGPNERDAQVTGLVIGYVQSGKTLSFTALTAMARDNEYKLIIVLGGTTTTLVKQSYDRLAKDLDMDNHGQRIWSMFQNPDASPENIEEVTGALQTWESYPNRPDRCQTVVIVAMKNHLHLKKLQKLLKDSNLSGVSAIVIDDEGDQAGLNNKARQDAESTTYTCIRLLREVLPTHTYLLYTATPQAPLLISRIDMLSPQFADPIQPGADYIGGRELFFEGSRYIELIPEEDLPDEDASAEPPESLKRALRLFFIGVAAGFSQKLDGNRSMMVHPSSLRDFHRQFVGWIGSVRANWLAVLRDADGSPEKRELIESFRESYDDLERTDSSLPSFDAIVEELSFGIDRTQIKEVNARSGKLPVIPWGRYYSFILVGGTGLDRGFTVEGLTVTYMSRGAGVGNADTVQQRGRFFGYKRGYLGLIRIFLEETVADSFSDYVAHEQNVRNSLIRYRDSGRPLSEWRRAFFLDASMSPTRKSVLSFDYMRKRGRDWIHPDQPHSNQTVLTSNRKVVSEFIRKYANGFRESPGSDKRTPEQRHLLTSDISLEAVYRELLVPMSAAGDDLLDYLHVQLQIERELEPKESRNDRAEVAGCDVYVMRKGDDRRRTVNRAGNIDLLQGSNEATGYPGDRALRAADRVSVQIHMLQIEAGNTNKDDETPPGTVLERRVPCLAISIPERMRGDAIFEPVH